MNEQEKNTEITLGFLVSVLRRRLIPLVLALVLGAAAAFAVTKLFIDPEYSSRAEFCVENTYESPSMMQSGYQSGAALLASSYAYEVTGNVFLGDVLSAYNAKYGTQMTIKELSRKVSVTADGDLPVFAVKITSTDREEAYNILKIIEEKAPVLLLNDSTKQYINIKLIGYGHLAEAPDSPNVLLNTAVGGMLIAVLAYVFFFLCIFLDKTVYNEEALKSNFGKIPVVGQIPQWIEKSETGKKHEHFDTDQDPAKIVRNYDHRLLNKRTPFSVSESFKTLRTNLTYVAVKDKGAPVFGVTSGFAGAGKSVVLANVAVSFAQLGKKVLLIDGDMRCPTQHKIFDVPAEHYGLSEALVGIVKDPFAESVVANAYQGMDLMTCGRIPPNPSELLASDNLSALIEEARSRYDYIFIDLPPILETADAGVITSLVSGYIIVARARYSKIDVLSEVIDTMQAMHANIVGFVLNDVSARGGLGYYANYSHYGHYSHYGRYNRYRRYSRSHAEVDAAASEAPAVEEANKQPEGVEEKPAERVEGGEA